MTNNGDSMTTFPCSRFPLNSRPVVANKPVTLTGFGGFLDQRHFAFVSPRPADALRCNICGIVSPEPKRLSCEHVLCDVCYQEVTRDNSLCPFKDGASCEPKTNSPVPGICKRIILEHDVHCLNVMRGCTFRAKMDEVRAHFLEDCSYGEVTCSRCGTPLVHNKVVDHWFRDCDGSRDTSLRKKVCPYGKDAEDADDSVDGDELERSLRKFLLSNMRDHDMLVRSQNCIVALATDLLNPSMSHSRSSTSRAPADAANVQRIFRVLSLPGQFPLGEAGAVVRWNPEGAVQYFTASGRSFQLRYFSVENEDEKAVLFEIRMLFGFDEPRKLRFDGKLTLLLGGSGGMGLEALPTLRCSAPAGTNQRRANVAAHAESDKEAWLTVAVTEPVGLERLQKSGLFGLACFAVEVA